MQRPHPKTTWRTSPKDVVSFMLQTKTLQARCADACVVVSATLRAQVIHSGALREGVGVVVRPNTL